MPDSHTVAVLGGGSFGTVIANIIATNGNRVRLWLRNADRADEINRYRENSEYLPGYRLHEALTEAVRARTGLKRVIFTNVKDYLPPLSRWLFTLTREKQEGHQLFVPNDEGVVRWSDLLRTDSSRPPEPYVDLESLAVIQYIWCGER